MGRTFESVMFRVFVLGMVWRGKENGRNSVGRREGGSLDGRVLSDEEWGWGWYVVNQCRTRQS